MHGYCLNWLKQTLHCGTVNTQANTPCRILPGEGFSGLHRERLSCMNLRFLPNDSALHRKLTKPLPSWQSVHGRERKPYKHTPYLAIGCDTKGSKSSDSRQVAPCTVGGCWVLVGSGGNRHCRHQHIQDILMQSATARHTVCFPTCCALHCPAHPSTLHRGNSSSVAPVAWAAGPVGQALLYVRCTTVDGSWETQCQGWTEVTCAAHAHRQCCLF